MSRPREGQPAAVSPRTAAGSIRGAAAAMPVVTAPTTPTPVVRSWRDAALAFAAAGRPPVFVDPVADELLVSAFSALPESLFRAPLMVRGLELLRSDDATFFSPAPGVGFLAGAMWRTQFSPGRAAFSSGFLGRQNSLLGSGVAAPAAGSGFLGGISLLQLRAW
ncbi:MAG: hypothetical protein V3R95_02960 [Dehalococcoidia bacterium]